MVSTEFTVALMEFFSYYNIVGVLGYCDVGVVGVAMGGSEVFGCRPVEECGSANSDLSSGRAQWSHSGDR